MIRCKSAAAGSLFLILALRIISLHAQIEVSIPASKDNTLYENTTGAFSNGAGEYVFVGNNNHDEARRALLTFDVAAHIPAGVVIQSVQLSLNMSRTVSNSQTVTLHRVLADWGEGVSNATGEEGGSVGATPGDATWLHRFFNAQLWANAGGDFSSEASATQTVNLNGVYSWGSTAEMVADVQSWLNTPSNNFGWILVSAQAAKGSVKRFDSRENGEADTRPILSVTYGAPSAILDGKVTPPFKFELAQNYPNPFNPETTLRFTLPHEAYVTLQVFTILGNEVTVLINGSLPAGEHQARFVARDLASGVYLFRLTAAEFVSLHKGLLLQ